MFAGNNELGIAIASAITAVLTLVITLVGKHQWDARQRRNGVNLYARVSVLESLVSRLVKDVDLLNIALANALKEKTK